MKIEFKADQDQVSDMKPNYVFITENVDKSTLILNLHFTQEIENLPFPMNLDRLYKFFISLMFMLVLGFGVRYRIKIFKYLTSDEVKLGPINVLIWIISAQWVVAWPVDPFESADDEPGFSAQ